MNPRPLDPQSRLTLAKSMVEHGVAHRWHKSSDLQSSGVQIFSQALVQKSAQAESEKLPVLDAIYYPMISLSLAYKTLAYRTKNGRRIDIQSHALLLKGGFYISLSSKRRSRSL